MIRLIKALCGARSRWGTTCVLEPGHEPFYHSDDDGRIWS